MIKVRYMAALAAIGVAAVGAVEARAAGLSFVGSDYDIGGTYYPGGGAPYVVVPWRSESDAKQLDIDGNNVYGSAGYAMFATQSFWPSAGCCGSPQPFDSATWPNKIELPSFVSSSQPLVNNKVGGWGYALVDDPALVNGYRDFNWGNTQTPPVSPPNSQSPFVKIGILEGIDKAGNNPRTSADGAGRWEFTIGSGAPPIIRVGVMTDGLDANTWTSTEVLLHQTSGGAIVSSATTDTLPIGNILPPPDYIPGINRMVDVHVFDIIGAQPGDTFAVYSKAFADGWGGVSAVTFDVVPEPTSVGFVASVVALGGLLTRGKRRS